MAPMRRRYKQNVRLTPRDLTMLELVGRQGLASLEQLHTSFWEGRQLQTARDRLHLLVKAGYLHAMITDARGRPEQVFWIERKARVLLPAEVREQLTSKRPPAAEIAHLLRAGDVWHVLARKHGRVEWVSERRLKSEKLKSRSSAGIADARVSLLCSTQ